MKVIILAGGRGTRLPASAKDIPKALVEIEGKPILQHQLDLLERHGLTDIRLALGYRAEKVIEYMDGRYEHVVEPEPLGTGGAIKFASEDLNKNETFMVINGDILSNVDVAEFVRTHRKRTNAMVIAYESKNKDFGMIDINESGKILAFKEKPQTPQDGYVNVGFYILNSDLIAAYPKRAFSIEYDIFPQLAHAGMLHSFIHKGFWIDIGTEERLVKSKQQRA